MKSEFERVKPETVGIRSGDILQLIEDLEEQSTELHGIMIMRKGKICAEGWWQPYAPGLRHGLQSLTKTYTATAIGIAYTQGILSLEDKLTDIFPDKAPTESGENLGNLKIRDVLCMGCGMHSMPYPTEDWIYDFLHTEVKDRPGTTFMYNSIGSSLLGAVIYRVTGKNLHTYLKENLFHKIGICEENLKWSCMPDGTEAGGCGLFATTEDNLRLMKLYLDDGMWNGERILSSEYVRLATSKQNDSSSELIKNPCAADNSLGYGFQIWMCRPQGVYRADGALGQFSICFPKLEMIISINQAATGAEGVQNTLDCIWDFSDKLDETCSSYKTNEKESKRLSYKMKHLSTKSPGYTKYNRFFEKWNHKMFRVARSGLSFEVVFLEELTGGNFSEGIKRFQFFFSREKVIIEFLQDDLWHSLEIAVDGSWQKNLLKVTGNVAEIILLSGTFLSDNTFRITAKWPETCFTKILEFSFIGEKCVVDIEIEPLSLAVPGNAEKNVYRKSIVAEAEK